MIWMWTKNLFFFLQDNKSGNLWLGQRWEVTDAHIHAQIKKDTNFQMFFLCCPMRCSILLWHSNILGPTSHLFFIFAPFASFLQPRLHRRVHHQLQRAVSRSGPVKRLRGERWKWSIAFPSIQPSLPRLLFKMRTAVTPEEFSRPDAMCSMDGAHREGPWVTYQWCVNAPKTNSWREIPFGLKAEPWSLTWWHLSSPTI